MSDGRFTPIRAHDLYYTFKPFHLPFQGFAWHSSFKSSRGYDNKPSMLEDMHLSSVISALQRPKYRICLYHMIYMSQIFPLNKTIPKCGAHAVPKGFSPKTIGTVNNPFYLKLNFFGYKQQN